MKNLLSINEAKAFFIEKIYLNLDQINVNSVYELATSTNLNVLIKTNFEKTNEDFTSLINCLKKFKQLKEIKVYDLTTFYYYYSNCLKHFNIKTKICS